MVFAVEIDSSPPKRPIEVGGRAARASRLCSQMQGASSSQMEAAKTGELRTNILQTASVGISEGEINLHPAIHSKSSKLIFFS
jgi:hypothetical protein